MVVTHTNIQHLSGGFMALEAISESAPPHVLHEYSVRNVRLEWKVFRFVYCRIQRRTARRGTGGLLLSSPGSSMAQASALLAYTARGHRVRTFPPCEILHQRAPSGLSQPRQDLGFEASYSLFLLPKPLRRLELRHGVTPPPLGRYVLDGCPWQEEPLPRSSTSSPPHRRRHPRGKHPTSLRDTHRHPTAPIARDERAIPASKRLLPAQGNRYPVSEETRGPPHGLPPTACSR